MNDRISFEQFQEMMRRASTSEHRVVGIAAVVVLSDGHVEMCMDAFPENVGKLVDGVAFLTTHLEAQCMPKPVLHLVKDE